MNWISPIGASAQSTPRILIVDDDPALVRMVRRVLMAEGFDADTAANGILGLQQLQEAAYDVVVLDLQMPQMDGPAMFLEMRRLGFSCPVLILSAYGADAARTELGAEAALNKPFDTDVLVSRIQQLLTR